MINGRGYVLVAAVACAACNEGPRWTGTLTDSAGIRIVINTADGMWAPGETWTVEEELRIGAVEEDPDFQFGMISFLAVGSDGTISVLDAQAQEIKQFTANGAHVRTLGGPGQGPGELQGAIFLFVGPGDTLFAPDNQNQRINRYAPDGSVLQSIPLRLETGMPVLFQATTTGRVAEQMRPIDFTGTAAPDSMDVVLLLASDGSVEDTLFTFPSGRTFQVIGGAPEFNFYTPEMVWLLADNTDVLFGVNDEYRITVQSADGTITRIVTMPFERRLVTEQDQQALLGFLDQMWVNAGVPPALLPRLHERVSFGESFPAFNAIQTGPAGTMWVQRVQTTADLTEEELENFNAFEDSGAPEWDVFDSEGRYLGVVAMPKRFAPRLFLGDQIYGVWRDDLDVQYVVRLRIRGIAPELAARWSTDGGGVAPRATSTPS